MWVNKCKCAYVSMRVGAWVVGVREGLCRWKELGCVRELFICLFHILLLSPLCFPPFRSILLCVFLFVCLLFSEFSEPSAVKMVVALQFI